LTASSRKFRLVFFAVLGALVLVLVPAALAGKGGGGGGGAGGGGKPGGGGTSGGSGSLVLSVVSSPYNDGLVHWGGQITFTVSTSATTEPHVSVTCSQNRTVVYSSATGYYAGYPWPWTQVMTLSSTAWSGGAASCTAKLYSLNNSGGTTTLGSLSFDALA
jgi:hypothetical protein